MTRVPKSLHFDVVIQIRPGHPNYGPKEVVDGVYRDSTALSQLQIIEADLRGPPLRCEYIGADNVLSLEIIDTSRESTPFDFFRAAMDGIDSSSSPEGLVAIDQFGHKKQEMELSPFRFTKNSGDMFDSPATSPENWHSQTEQDLYFVRRSMLEVPKKRRWRPASFSLSVRVPGSTVREIVHMEEVPVLCKRLKIIHRDSCRILELPQIMLTARRKSFLTTIKQEPCCFAERSPDSLVKIIECKNENQHKYDNIPYPEHQTRPMTYADDEEGIRTWFTGTSDIPSQQSQRQKRKYYKHSWWRLTSRIRVDFPPLPFHSVEHFTVLS